MDKLWKKIRLSLVPAVFIVTGVVAETTSPVPVPEPVQASVADIMADFDVSGLAIGRVIAGEIAWMGTFGQADENRPVNDTTPPGRARVPALSLHCFPTSQRHNTSTRTPGNTSALAGGW